MNTTFAETSTPVIPDDRPSGLTTHLTQDADLTVDGQEGWRERADISLRGPVAAPAAFARPAPLAANQILAALPEREFQRLRLLLDPVTLRPGQVLVRAAATPDHVYFINSGVVSLVTQMRDGSSIEVGMIGSEGLVDSGLVCGCDIVPHQAVVLIGGQAQRLPAAALADQIRQDSPLRTALLRFHGALSLQALQGAACNGLHQIGQRACRWMLMCHDRLQADQFALTHELLAKMLGVRRASVTQVLNTLQDKGCIHYTRGRITVHDRARLEAAACECYGHIHAAYRRALNGSPSA